MCRQGAARPPVRPAYRRKPSRCSPWPYGPYVRTSWCTTLCAEHGTASKQRSGACKRTWGRRKERKGTSPGPPVRAASRQVITYTASSHASSSAAKAGLVRDSSCRPQLHGWASTQRRRRGRASKRRGERQVVAQASSAVAHASQGAEQRAGSSIGRQQGAGGLMSDAWRNAPRLSVTCYELEASTCPAATPHLRAPTPPPCSGSTVPLLHSSDAGTGRLRPRPPPTRPRPARCCDEALGEAAMAAAAAAVSYGRAGVAGPRARTPKRRP